MGAFLVFIDQANEGDIVLTEEKYLFFDSEVVGN
jgi:hypothetical protein